VGLLKHFFDGFKNALCCVIDFAKGIPLSAINALPKAFLNPTESSIFIDDGYK